MQSNLCAKCYPTGLSALNEIMCPAKTYKVSVFLSKNTEIIASLHIVKKVKNEDWQNDIVCTF